MGFRDVLKRFGGKGGGNREMIHQLSEQMRVQRIAEERQLSPNERELNRIRNEFREESIKQSLEEARKARQDDIDFGHNPLDAENIITKKAWEVLKEKNQFAQKGNIFDSKTSVLKNDNKLLRTNKNLLRNNQKLLKGGNMFKK